MILSVNSFAQEKIKDFENRQIWIDNGFAGESISLVKESGKFIMLRKILGSGIPVIGELKYRVKFISAYELEFSEVISHTGKNKTPEGGEHFLLSLDNGQVSLYLNGLKVATKDMTQNNN